MWYIEKYDRDGKAAKWWDYVREFATVRTRLAEAVQDGEIFRISAPLCPTAQELDQLRALGAIQF